MYANIHISWETLNRAVMGIFRSKIEVKSRKSFCRGNFLFVPFNPLFHVWTMRQCFKNIPAKFQSRPTFLAGFFFQKSGGRRRSKEDFLPRFMKWVQLLNLVFFFFFFFFFSALLPWSTVLAIAAVYAFPVGPHSASFLQLSFDQHWFFIVLLELRTFVPDHVVAFRLFF